jgi:hypothetical protein
MYVGCVRYIGLNGHGLSEGGVNLGYKFVSLGCFACIVHHNREAAVSQLSGYSAVDPT